MKSAAKSAGVSVTFNRCGSMFCGYFTNEPVWNAHAQRLAESATLRFGVVLVPEERGARQAQDGEHAARQAIEDIARNRAIDAAFLGGP
mgnify:CR=1 FL=1